MGRPAAAGRWCPAAGALSQKTSIFRPNLQQPALLPSFLCLTAVTLSLVCSPWMVPFQRSPANTSGNVERHCAVQVPSAGQLVSRARRRALQRLADKAACRGQPVDSDSVGGLLKRIQEASQRSGLVLAKAQQGLG